MTAANYFSRSIGVLLVCLAGAAFAQVPPDPFNYSRASSFEYDQATGLLKVERVEPDNIASCVKTSYDYDAYGNKSGATSANCEGVVPARQQFTARTSATQYAPAIAQTVTVAETTLNVPQGMFPITVANALGQSETKSFDPRFGAVLSLTGPNQLTTSWQVDDFGRKTLEVRADNTRTVYLYCILGNVGLDTGSNSPGCPAPSIGEAPADAIQFMHSEPRNINNGQMGPFTRVYTDRLGRELRSVTESFDGAGQPAGAGVLIVKDTQYNTWGAKILETQPYFLATGSSTTVGANDAGMTLINYDALGRPTDIFVADPNGSQPSVSFAGRGTRQAAKTSNVYTGLTLTITNDKRQTRDEVKNANGELVRVTDTLGAQLAHQRDAFGNLVQTKDALQNTISVLYDIRGRKVQMNDPDTGIWQYDYNALGELVLQQSPKQRAAVPQQASTMSYDVLGRMIQRAEPEYVSTWSYDKYADASTCDKGTGKLCEVITTNGVNRKWVYDNLGRPVNARTTVAAGPSFASALVYDPATGRVASQVYPSGLQVNYAYTARGLLEKLTLATAATVNPLPDTPGGTPGASTTLAAGSLLWQAQAVNAWGKVARQSYGNGVTSTAGFEALTGRTVAAVAGLGAASNVLNHSYAWDSLNNLTSRIDANGDGSGQLVNESFDYDELNRLRQYIVVNPAIAGSSRHVILQYNALGSILYKSDVGVYSYAASGVGAVRPHALANVTGASTTTYTYDANGNLATASAGKYRALSYTSFNLPDSQSGVSGPGVNGAGADTYTWSYDENHARLKETRVIAGGTNAGTRTTWYLHPDNAGGLSFESEVNAPASASAANPALTSNRHYLSAGGMAIGVLVSTGALPALAGAQTAPSVLAGITLVKVEYWHKDHLGSLVATTDHAGAVTARYAYDPFGKRRYPNGVYDVAGVLIGDNSPAVNAGSDRGYTGHEMLDDIGLIHMNGRLYDPALGVFLQGDPYIQAPGNLQSYNRYSYVLNNPLTSTDPSGYWSLWGFLKASLKFGLNPSPRNTFNLIHSQPGQQYVDKFIMTHSWAYTIGQGIAGFTTSVCGGCGAAAWSSYYAYQSTGSMNEAYRAGAISWASTYVSIDGNGWAGGVGQDYGILAHYAARAAVGCAATAIGGGNCRTGALAGMASLEGEAFGFPGAVVAGGIGSVLGGGKFANGAVTGAFGFLFNCMAHECLQHYMQGSGTPMQASFSELGADNVGPDRFPQYRSLVSNEDLPDGTYTVKDSIGWQTQSLNAQAAYGRVILQLNGVLTVSQGQYNFTGMISAPPDLYDFDKLPWGVRSYSGEISTRGGAMLPGKPFYNVFSGNKPVSANGSLSPF